MSQLSYLIRNDSLGLRQIGTHKILPGETKRIPTEDLKPFMGNKAFAAAFKRGPKGQTPKLVEVQENTPPPPDFLRDLENRADATKPEPQIGEAGGKAVHLTSDNKANQRALDEFLQSGQVPANAQAAAQTAAALASGAPSTPPAGEPAK